jgi:hypothetical protein
LGVLGVSGFTAGLCFLTILLIGFVYEWKKGALDWSQVKSKVCEVVSEMRNFWILTFWGNILFNGLWNLWSLSLVVC